MPFRGRSMTTKHKSTRPEIDHDNAALSKAYLRDMADRNGWNEKTVTQGGYALARVRALVGGRSFRHFDRAMAHTIRDGLIEQLHQPKPRALATVANHLSWARKFFSWLAEGRAPKIKHGDIETIRLEANQARSLRYSKPKQRVQSVENVRAMLDAIEGDDERSKRDRALIAVLAATGLRIDTVISLTVGCFDESSKVFDIDPARHPLIRVKLGLPAKVTILSLLPDLEEHIVGWWRYLVEQRRFGSSHPLFPRNAEDGVGDEPWTSSNSARAILKQRAKAAGVPNSNPHSYRHMVGTVALRRIRTMTEFKALSQNLGHRSLDMTMSYGRLGPDEHVGILKGVDFAGAGAVDQISEEGVLGDVRELAARLPKEARLAVALRFMAAFSEEQSDWS